MLLLWFTPWVYLCKYLHICRQALCTELLFYVYGSLREGEEQENARKLSQASDLKQWFGLVLLIHGAIHH